MKRKSAFTPTPRMIAAVESYLAARLCEERIKPIVIGYETAILGRYRFKAEGSTHSGEEDIILDPKRSYRISKADSETYFAECRKARAAEQLTIDGEDPDTCPLRKAHLDVVMAENEVIQAMTDLPQLASLGKDLFVLKLEDRKMVVELSIGLIEPFVSDDRAIRIAHASLVKYPRFATESTLPH